MLELIMLYCLGATGCDNRELVAIFPNPETSEKACGISRAAMEQEVAGKASSYQLRFKCDPEKDYRPMQPKKDGRVTFLVE